MKVLLLKDVEKVGWLGDVVEVKEGYMRNFLHPQGFAIIPTESNLRSIAKEKAERAEQRKLEHQQLEKAAEAVEGAEAVIAAKANEQGHLFGSVTAAEIAANLREQGFQVAEKFVRLAEHIKEIGTYDVKLRFAEGVSGTVKVTVVANSESEVSQ
jgi:large subunit ribosomal protein L9